MTHTRLAVRIRASHVVILAGLGALLFGVTACRREVPRPPCLEDGTCAGGGGVGGTGGTTPMPGTGGTTQPPPPPDAPEDMKPPPVDMGPACGGPGQACCPGNICLNSGCCEKGTCTSFGSPCRLAPGNSCLGSSCSNECGGEKLKCCGKMGERNCTYPLTKCEGVAPGPELCVACGKPGTPCCDGDFCGDGLMCMAGKCAGMPVGADQ